MSDDDALPFSRMQIELVQALVDRRGVSAAAASLGVSQPTASQRLARIEDALGRRLFERMPGGLKPNRNAEAYLVFAEAMRRIGAEARRFFSDEKPSTTLRLGVNEDVARTVLPEVLALFSRMHPDFSYRVSSNLSTPLFAAFDRDELDVVIGKRPAGRSRSKGAIRRESYDWYAGPDLVPPAEGPVALAVYPAPSETRDVMLLALAGAGREARIVFEAASLAALEGAVRAGLGVSGFSAMGRTEGLVRLAPGVLPALGEVDLVLERRPGATNAIEAFGAIVEQVVALLGDGPPQRPG